MTDDSIDRTAPSGFDKSKRPRVSEHYIFVKSKMKRKYNSTTWDRSGGGTLRFKNGKRSMVKVNYLAAEAAYLVGVFCNGWLFQL